LEEAERIYKGLSDNGVETLIDDRDQRSPGVKFNDADLIGFPVQVIIGKKGIAEGKIEIKLRQSGEKIKISTDNALAEILKLISGIK